jgi:hypothetical protein
MEYHYGWYHHFRHQFWRGQFGVNGRDRSWERKEDVQIRKGQLRGNRSWERKQEEKREVEGGERKEEEDRNKSSNNGEVK